MLLLRPGDLSSDAGSLALGSRPVEESTGDDTRAVAAEPGLWPCRGAAGVEISSSRPSTRSWAHRAQNTAGTGWQVKFARGSGGLVLLTVSYKSAEANVGELGVTIDVVETKLGAKARETESVSGIFQLHIATTSYDYAATYGRILAADRAALRELAEGTSLRDRGINVTSSVG